MTAQLSAADLLDALPQQLAVLNAGLAIIDANAGLLKQTGLNLPMLQAQGWLSLLHADDRPVFEFAWAEAQASRVGFAMDLFDQHDALIENTALSSRIRPQESDE